MLWVAADLKTRQGLKLDADLIDGLSYDVAADLKTRQGLKHEFPVPVAELRLTVAADLKTRQGLKP